MFYVIEDLQPTSCSPFPDAESVLKAATWKVRLHETLFMEHADQARRAAEFLFRLKQQPDVERALTAHLKHPFQEVRRNVAQALGLPSFQASISLKMPPPTLKNLLEPVTVQPDTLKQMLSAINTEADLEVLHWLLCTVSAQFFGGKLRPFIRETETLSRELDAKFGSQLSSDTISLRKALSQQA